MSKKDANSESRQYIKDIKKRGKLLIQKPRFKGNKIKVISTTSS